MVKTLVTRKMETEVFGDSNATRTTDAFLEMECVENVATTEIIKATEESNGHRVSRKRLVRTVLIFTESSD